MMPLALTWILCDLSLVHVQLSGLPDWVRMLCVALAGGLLCAWLVWKSATPLWRAFVVATGLAVFAWWRVTDVASAANPSELTGEWVGRWTGLPGKASAMFQPVKKLAGDAPSKADCELQALPFRLWVRGVKAERVRERSVAPGVCVHIRLAVDESGKPVPALESWRQRNRIAASLRLEKGSDIRVLDPRLDRIDGMRLSIREQFDAMAAQEAGYRYSHVRKLPVLLGLVTGDRALMSTAHWQLFADTGTSHLMAISGSHVSFFAVLVYWLVRRVAAWPVWLTRHLPAPHIAAVAGFFGALGYALLAGFNVPTQRTLVMIGVVVFLKLRGRSLLSWQTWWLALVAVTLYDPLAILDRGAWLSFFAVALILWVLQGRVRPLGVVKGWLAVQLAIFLGLAPLLAYAFGGFPLVAPFANAIAIPAVSFIIVPGALLLAALAALPDLLSVPELLLKLLLPVLLWCSDVFFVFLRFCAEWGGAGYQVPPQQPLITVCGLLGALWLMAPGGVPGKRIAAVLLLPGLLGPVYAGVRDTGMTALPAKRQMFVLEDAENLWWIFEAGSPSMTREPLLRQYLRERGYGYRWAFTAERYADWVRSGYVIHHYPKQHLLPGQVTLGIPRMHLPCISETGPRDQVRIGRLELLPLMPNPRACWLLLGLQMGNGHDNVRLSQGQAPKLPENVTAATSVQAGMSLFETSLLMAGDMRHDTQLQMAQLQKAEAPLSATTLLLRPLSGGKLTGAMLDRYAPQVVVEWPSRSSFFPGANPRLDVRRIRLGSLDDVLLPWLAEGAVLSRD